MKLSEASRLTIQSFFREHLKDETLVIPEIRIHTGRITRLLARSFGFHGITFGPRVFIVPELFRRNERRQLVMPSALVVHEVAHVIQYRRDGFIRFLSRYLAAYRENLRALAPGAEDRRHRAYLDILYEIEAREAASLFLVWNERRKRAEFTR